MFAHRRKINHCVKIALLAVMALPLGTALAQDDQEKSSSLLLQQQRWEEQAYGISLAPPVAATTQSVFENGVLLRMYIDGQYQITVSLKKTDFEVTMANVQDQALKQLQLAHPTAAIFEQKEIKPARRPGALMHVAVPGNEPGVAPENQKNWVLSQAFMQVDPNTVLMLRMESSVAAFEEAQKVFEAVIDSLQVMDPAQLDERRTEWIDNGQKWLKSVDWKKRHNTVGEQWLRVLENGSDVGWLRIKVTDEGDVLGVKGLEVSLLMRLFRDQMIHENTSNYFLSEDEEREVWFVNQAVRSRQKNTQSPSFSWSEIGLREAEVITVTRETPSSRQKFQWQKPKAYLNQFDLMQIGALTRTLDQKTMGFYVFNSTSNSVTLCTARLVRNKDGTVSIFIRTSPEQPEIQSTYDRQGNLLHRALPGGRELRQSSEAQIKSMWPVEE